MKKFAIPMLVIFACLIMGIVDAVIQPGYIVKSVIKIIMFLFIPVMYSVFCKKKKLAKASFSLVLII